MREANKSARRLSLTRQDIKSALNDPKIELLDRMLGTDIYAFRVKAMLYKRGDVSPRGFLMNDDIYNLPIGKKNAKGEIMIDNDIIPILDRFTLANDLALKGDAITAFLVDHHDEMYDILKKAGTEEAMSEADYIQFFNLIYNDISNTLVDVESSDFIAADEKLLGALTAIQESKSTDVGTTTLQKS